MNAIKEMRKAAGLSQEAVAEKLNVTQGAISQWETGQASPMMDKLPELARILGCDVSELFEKEVG